MEVEIQADFSEGQPLPSQAAMQPLVAQIMRAVTGQGPPPVRPSQQASRATLPPLSEALSFPVASDSKPLSLLPGKLSYLMR